MCTVQQHEGSFVIEIGQDDAIVAAGLNLSAEWAAGKASGAPVQFDMDDPLAEARRKLAQEVAE